MTTSHAQPAPEPDLFGSIGAPADSVLIEVTGRLLADAVVRSKPCDHGQARPVLCLHLMEVGPSRLHVHIERPFEADNRFAADAQAAHLKRGMLVTVAAQLGSSVLTLTRAVSITGIDPATHPTPPGAKGH